ncbi:MAG: UDP-N-acetylmuramoyl-L-alanine--D-glutamate ligase [Patescibacteria group bacterium]|nr:UDP-N-acetylmuramoyl-L-alanine--D-glutamate ligase [Patescibacteria group bacterium]
MEHRHKKIAILGFGKEGYSALRFLRREPRYRHSDIWILDKNENIKLPRGVFSQLGEHYREGLDRFDLVIRSPGICYKASNATSPTRIFFEHCPAPIIGVTGTKGKGTTSTLIYKILREWRMENGEWNKVFLVGNIGKPALDILPKLDKKSIVVYEMSSFQLVDLRQSPHIAVALMITSEHLDWHKNVKEYRDAKSNIVRYQQAKDFAVLAQDYPASRAFAKLTKTSIFSFTRSAALKKDYIRRSSNLILRGAWVEDGWFYFSDGKKKEKICATADLQIPGEHNWENVGAAITVAKILKVPNGVIAETIRRFKGLEHRLEFVAKKDGIRFYNDSYSTTPETAIAAIRAFKEPKILILGGSSKGSDFRELGEVISKSGSIRGIIGIGVEWKRIKEAIPTRRRKAISADRISSQAAGHESAIPVVENCKTMNQIVRAARKLAKPGDVVLLSPGCASFGMFKNYSDRGVQFKREVNGV